MSIDTTLTQYTRFQSVKKGEEWVLSLLLSFPLSWHSCCSWQNSYRDAPLQAAPCIKVLLLILHRSEAMDGYVFNRGLSARHFSHPEECRKQQSNAKQPSTKVRMRGRQGKQLCPGCWKCRYSCQLNETIHPPILCPDSPFELQNNDLTPVPTGKATQRRTEGRRCSGWGR